MASASAPAASASCRTSSTSEERSTRASLPPSRAMRSATERPMPCAAPVTTAILPAKRPVRFVIIASRRLTVGLADRGHGAARRELLVVEIGRGHALPAEPAAHRVDHRRRSAEIDVDLAAIEVPGLDMAGDVALARVVARVGRDAGGEGEARDAGRELFELLDTDEVGVVG